MIPFRTIAFLVFAAFVSSAAGSQVAEDPMAIARRAWQLQQAADYVGAVEAYRAFLELRPDEAGARSNLGASLVKLGQYDEAIEEYRKAEKLLPGEPRIGMNLALAYQKSGRIRDQPGNVTVQPYGNVLAAISFLEGLACEDLKRSELDARDRSYEVLIAVRAVKPG